MDKPVFLLLHIRVFPTLGSSPSFNRDLHYRATWRALLRGHPEFTQGRCPQNLTLRSPPLFRPRCTLGATRPQTQTRLCRAAAGPGQDEPGSAACKLFPWPPHFGLSRFILDLQQSNLIHFGIHLPSVTCFGLTFVELPSFWTEHWSNFIHFGDNNVELHSFRNYIF